MLDSYMEFGRRLSFEVGGQRLTSCADSLRYVMVGYRFSMDLAATCLA
jgi:hypothetical protein